MIISFTEISKYFGSNLILDKISANINTDSRIGIIGTNGAGKTTLLNIISGKESYDEGTLYINPDITIGYLKQNSLISSDKSVYEEMRSVFSKEDNAIEQLKLLDLTDIKQRKEYDRLLAFINSRDAYNVDVKINYILNGMGFTEHQKHQLVSSLSGGECTRLALAKLLLSDANVLLLDEPTNHLDFKTCSWLEKYISEYKGAVICVTHDRYFLDKVCNKIWEIEFGKITEYNENYSSYKIAKAKQLEQQEKIYLQQIEQQEKLKDYIARNLVRASTSGMAKSRRKELERMGEVEKPKQYTKQINVSFKMANKSWFDVLKTNDLAVSINGRLLFSKMNLDIKSGERIAFIGDNGAGKTTLFKTLLGNHTEYSGKFRWGKEIDIGVYEQNHLYSDVSKTVKDELWDTYPNMNEQQLRSILASVLFIGDDVDKQLSNISGGESARLQLAILSQKFNNVLMMDEPTNHLDMLSKEKLEKALTDFKGTELIISHDRYFLNNIPDKIVYISDNKVIVFNGKYDDFQKTFILSENDVQTQIKKSTKNNEGYKTKEDRVKEAKKRAEISKAEKEIELLENKIKELEQFINDNQCDFEKLTEACSLLESTKSKLDIVTEQWLELSENM